MCLFNGAATSPLKAPGSQLVGEASEGDESLPSPGLTAPGSMLSASGISSRIEFRATRKKWSLDCSAGTLHSRRFTSIGLPHAHMFMVGYIGELTSTLCAGKSQVIIQPIVSCLTFACAPLGLVYEQSYKYCKENYPKPSTRIPTNLGLRRSTCLSIAHSYQERRTPKKEKVLTQHPCKP